MTYILYLIVLFIAELAYFHIANRFNIIDKPNERSSHSRVTLRGGGIIFYIGILLYFGLRGFQYPWFFVGLTLITLISFADDVHPQSKKLRLSIHFMAMVLMFNQWSLFSNPWYYTIIAIIICTGILNAFNFMDGINGMTGFYSLVVIGSFWYINTYEIQFVDNNFIYALIMALLVFNFFNFRTNAKCFAGDVGAISIAFMILFLLGLLVIKTKEISYIILLVVYGIDSVLTILHRLILRENIFLPHRKHAFQIMANELKIPQVLVSLFYGFLQALVVVGYFLCKPYSYWYLGAVILILSLSYLLFQLKYYKLHVLNVSEKNNKSFNL
ncbi:MAG: UDP-GlcNAc--UDP-phosphate GlcNAc-1-phosphate transferase [Bacteroidota bacterium]|nr:UDP-GlcNAc--UDP-phosphate GlcNAc-1-phosphate transferase [Bacteroidota bacterium]